MKKLLVVAAVRLWSVSCDFQFDSPARVCFLSVRGAANLKFLLIRISNGKSKSGLESWRCQYPPCFPKWVRGSAIARTSEQTGVPGPRDIECADFTGGA